MPHTRILLFLVAIAIFLLGGCASPHKDGLYPPVPGNENNQRIFFVAYESHTGIIVDRQNAAPWLPVLANEFMEARYLEFGWGDLDWYRTDKRTSGMAFGALFVPTDSGLWVWALPDEPEGFFKKNYITELTLSKQGFINLVTFINGSFALDENHRPQSLKTGAHQGAQYRIYLARGDYHAFRTCNHWTAEAMNQAGFATGFSERYDSEAFLHRVEAEQADYQRGGRSVP
jgi:uncharacterized protein (TIGR02117 family)